MDLMQWLTTDLNGEFLLTLLVSMVPVVELRGGIPFGVAAGLPVWAAYLAAVIGNLLPVPFIVVYIRRIFMFMRQHMPRLNSLVDRMEEKAHLKSASVLKYQYLGLAIFVAIPLPGTGAWTGAYAPEEGPALHRRGRAVRGADYQHSLLWSEKLLLREHVVTAAAWGT